MTIREKLLTGVSRKEPATAKPVTFSLGDLGDPTLPDFRGQDNTDSEQHDQVAPPKHIPASRAIRGPPVPADATYINARQYCDRLGGISFTTLARMLERDSEMPRPIYFANHIRFFKLADIRAYERLCEIRSAAKALNRNT